MRLRILLFFILVKMVLMFANGRRATFGTTLLLAANWKALVKFWRVPTSEPTTLILFSTRRGIFRLIDFGGRLTATTRLLARTALTAELNAALATAVTTAA